MSEKIFILGAGNVGSALGRGWLSRGYDVRFGVPDPANGKYPDVPRDRLQPANERGDAKIVVLAVPYAAAANAVQALGDLSGVTLIDCTNPLRMGAGGLKLTLGYGTSGAEQLAAAAKGASVFKAFNQTGAENLAEPHDYHPAPVMFVAGDDAQRKPQVLTLVSVLGFEAIDAGPLSAARLLEPLAMLWIDLATKRGQGREFALALVRRAQPSTSRRKPS